MDSAPLNLAHFHERRAEKFLRHNNYDDALRAIDCALLYLQDAYKCVRIPKAIEVLDTEKWDLERKLKQIQIRKQQYERGKLKEIVPAAAAGKKEAAAAVALNANNASTLTLTPRADNNNITAQCVAKSIDKTIREMGAKCNANVDEQIQKENADPKMTNTLTFSGNNDGQQLSIEVTKTEKSAESSNVVCQLTQQQQHQQLRSNDCSDVGSLSTLSDCDLPTLAPLELPTFDFNFDTASQPQSQQPPPPITTITGLAEGFQK